MTIVLALSVLASVAAMHAAQSGATQAQSFDPARARPLDVARVLAAKYPASPIMSYIPALAWSAALRLAQLTGEDEVEGETAARDAGVSFRERSRPSRNRTS